MKRPELWGFSQRKFKEYLHHILGANWKKKNEILRCSMFLQAHKYETFFFGERRNNKKLHFSPPAESPEVKSLCGRNSIKYPTDVSLSHRLGENPWSFCNYAYETCKPKTNFCSWKQTKHIAAFFVLMRAYHLLKLLLFSNNRDQSYDLLTVLTTVRDIFDVPPCNEIKAM